MASKSGRKSSTLPKSSTNKAHTKFKEKIHQGTPYLKEIIMPGEDDTNTKFICKACKNLYRKNFDGYCENLKVHMKTDQHKETLIPFEWLKSWKVSLKHVERMSQILETFLKRS